MKTLKDIDKVKLQEKIDYIFNNFDSRKVAKAMKAANWAWAITKGGKTRFAVPDEKEIRSRRKGTFDRYDYAPLGRTQERCGQVVLH